MGSQGFDTVGVVGGGQMGSGIAQVIATSGAKVFLCDISPNQIEKAKNNIKRSAYKLLTKEKIEQREYEQALEIKYTGKLEALENCDLVIEAISENEEAKAAIFKKLDEILNEKACIATNTSSISITRLAANTKRPDKCVGMHFMNPVPIMKLVEIIPGLTTSEETTKKVTQLATGLGKSVTMSKDYPGFVVNRILMPMINEAFTALMEGVASPEDIDNGMCLGTNQPMGPLKLADFIGLDTCLAIMKVLHEGLGDSKYRPSPLLVQYVDAGWLGKKVNRGVYAY